MHVISAYVPALSTGGGSPGGLGSGWGGDEPLGPNDPGGPNHEWFRRGRIDSRKFSEYLFVARHLGNLGKAEGWSRVFGLGSGDEETAAGLLRGQLGRAAIEEIETLTRDDRTFRRWELLIPDFEVNGRVAPLLTGWALRDLRGVRRPGSAFRRLHKGRGALKA